MKKASLWFLVVLCLLSLSALACDDLNGDGGDDNYEATITIEADPVDTECVSVCDLETCWVECEDDDG